MDIMISLHSINTHPTITVINEKLDISVKKLWVIVISVILCLTVVGCYMFGLMTHSSIICTT